VAELVDALDLGSSGAIRGGSSPPFRIAHGFNGHRGRIHEAKKRDPGLLKKEEEPATPWRSRYHQTAGARAAAAGALDKTSCDIDEVGAQRIVGSDRLKQKEPASTGRLFFVLRASSTA
jgi:hypothetical protein